MDYAWALGTLVIGLGGGAVIARNRVLETRVLKSIDENQTRLSESIERLWTRTDTHETQINTLETCHKINHPEQL